MGADAAEQSAIEFGDIAVSGFSGTKLQSERLAPNVDPVTKTVLDPDGATLQVLNATALGALTGQQQLSPPRLSFKARDIGHVFALAFDNGPDTATPAPSLFAAATSAFGLHVVGPDKDGDGQPDRLEKGAPGATFMEGQFGALPGGGPGTIWKIDHKTGTPSLFAEAETGGLKNSGPGIGGLAFDPKTRTLYASDLDTGLIHRFDVADGKDAGQFDYGVTARPSRNNKPSVQDDGRRLDITSPAFVATDPATWGFTQKERRIDALAVHNGRLYFAVAEGPEIWSVGLEEDGAFKTDARFEVALEDKPPFPITGLAFDASGRMILAQRGEVQNPADYSSFTAEGPARVLRYTLESSEEPDAPGLWKLPPEEYAVGEGEQSRASAGGVALGYTVSADGTLDTATCSGTLVASADTLGPDRAIQGLQLSAVGIVRPANVPPKESAIIAWRPDLADPEAHGYAGSVAVLHSCPDDADIGFPDLAGTEDGGFPGLADGGGGGGSGGSGGGGFPGVTNGGGTTFPDLTDEGEDEGEGGKVQIGPFTIEKTGTAATCSETAPCTFDIAVTNTTAEPIPGPVTIADTFTVGGAPAPDARLTAPPPAPWTCVAAAGGAISCSHPGPIPANASLAPSLSMSFLPGPVGIATEVQNCATIGAEGADNAPSACATIPVGPAQIGPITTVKRSTSACTAKGPCAFTITLTNSTDAEIAGPITVDEQIDAPQATFVGAPNAPWSCSPNAPFTCQHPGPLAPGQSIELQLAFAPNTPPEKTELRNCAVPRQPAAASPPPPPPGQQNIAPEKKTEAPFGRSLVQSARFTPQSFRRQSLFTLAGGAGAPAGGSIGGAGAPRQSPCRKFLKDGFSVQQGNGPLVSFTNLSQINGNLRGSASFIAPDRTVKGTVTGNIGATDFRIVVDWDGGARGIYEGTIAPGGTVTGTTTDANVGARAPITGVAALVCVEDEACEKYAKDAITRAGVFAGEKCGPVQGRWSRDKQHHMDFCMRQPPDGPLIEQENTARLNELRECQARNAATKLRCEEFAKNGVSMGQEFTALKCAEEGRPGVLSINLDEQMRVCLANPTEQFFASAKRAREAHLNLCKAKVAANEGEEPGPGPGPGPEPGPGPGPEPAAEQCATVAIDPEPEAPKQLVIAKNAVVETCSEAGGCNFVVSITNTGDTEFTNPIAFTNFVSTADGRPLPNANFGNVQVTGAVGPDISAPFMCSTGGGGLTCATGALKVRIPPKRTITLPMSITPGPTGGATAIRSCAQMQLDNFAEQVCRNIPLVKPPHLAIVKTGAPTCELRGACEFGILINNNGPGVYNGPITFTDEVPETTDGGVRQPIPAGVESFTPGWTCTRPAGVRSLSCTHEKTTLAPGEALPQLVVLVTPGPGWKKNNILVNCATIKKPIGNDTGANPADARSCFDTELDPFAVEVTKTGDQVCPPGSNCTFKITLSNPGPIDHNAPVTITDRLTGLSSAEIVSIAPPLPCATQPTQIPFSCTSPGPVRLDLDAAPGTEFGPRDFVMVVKLPNDASAEQFSNCASASGEKGSTDEACAVVSTKPTTPEGACAGGMVMTARGCVCPMPSKWDGTACVGAGVISAPSQPEPPPAEPPPVAETPQPPVVATAPPTCFGGMILVEDACACPPPTQWNGRICATSSGGGGTNASQSDDPLPPPTPRPERIRHCPADLPVGTFPNCCPRNSQLVGTECRCLPGFEARRRECRPIPPKEPPPPPPPPKVVTCPADKPVGKPPNCCPRNSRLVGRECQCLPGFQAFRRECRPLPKCPPNARLVGNECRCDPGFEMRRRVCRPVQQQPRTCPPNLPVGTFPNCCPQNAQFVNGRCQCLPGFVNRRGQCRPAPQQPPPGEKSKPPRDCGPGYRPLDKPNKYGAYCELIPVPGPTPPPATAKCPTNAEGTPPNCQCRPGFRMSPQGRCLRIPQDRGCDGGKVFDATSKRCVCPRNKEEIKGQCIDKVN